MKGSNYQTIGEPGGHQSAVYGKRPLAAAIAAGAVVGLLSAFAAPGSPSTECDDQSPAWLACEDFEGGRAGWSAWFASSPFTECLGCQNGVNDPARIRLTTQAEHVYSGAYALEMPAEASAGYQGASLTFRSCAAEKRTGCRLVGYERLYFRTRVMLAEDHRLVHHFLEIAGTRPDRYWESDGNAGCRPNGSRWAGTTLDFDADRNLFFYTYFPEMRCDTGGYCSGETVRTICAQCAAKEMPCRTGPECCWGNLYRPELPVVLPRGEWVCLEVMMALNTPGQADGSMAFWVDGMLALQESTMKWRDTPDLQLNKAWLQHYIAAGDADSSNRIWFDDVIVSTEPIGCGMGIGTATSTVASPTPVPEGSPEPSSHFLYLPALPGGAARQERTLTSSK